MLFSILIFSVVLTQSFGYGGGKEPDPRVCGDRLCSQIPGGRDAWESKEPAAITIKNEPSMTSPSLKTQIKNGISPDSITCTEGLELIFKLRDNSPACVKPSSIAKLVERGWAISDFDESLTNRIQEESVSDVFKKFQQNPQKLRSFLEAMPKGGNIHHHLSGAVYAEDIFQIGVSKNLCVNLERKNILEPDKNTLECEGKSVSLSSINKNQPKYQDIINSWSIRGFDPDNDKSTSYFFKIFGKISNVTKDPLPLLVKVKKYASQENVSYIETMLKIADVNEQVEKLRKELDWNDDDFNDEPDKYLEKLHGQLIKNKLEEVAIQASDKIEDTENKSRTDLKCDQDPKNKGCEVTVHYLYHSSRTKPLVNVFVQLALAFEVAHTSYHVVGINLVGPEHNTTSLTNYTDHMTMVNFFHGKYEDVNISLHAGELWKNLVSDNDLKFHIHDAVFDGDAQRIGHGVDITFENNYLQLLTDMSRNKIAVEVSPVSNEFILGVSGQNHPFPLYLSNDVPITIASDDPGILDTDLTEQFVKIATNYPNDVNYETIKELVRNSLEFSFIPDDSLWQNKGDYSLKIMECSQDDPLRPISNQCNQYLSNNEKARLQWELEGDLYQFEVLR